MASCSEVIMGARAGGRPFEHEGGWRIAGKGREDSAIDAFSSILPLETSGHNNTT